MDEKAELIQKINKLDKQFERNKLIRSLITVALYSIANVVIAYLIFDSRDVTLDLHTILEIAIACTIFAGVSYVVNAAVFSFLIRRGQDEQETIESLNKRLDELREKDNAHYR